MRSRPSSVLAPWPSRGAARSAARAILAGAGACGIAVAYLVGAAGPAHAQAKPRRSSAVADAGAFAARAGSTTPGPAAPSNASADAGATAAATADGGLHVFKFTELDIEGRLKTPQLVYFLRRVRAEFAAEELGHRTFFREMSETRKESSF